MPRYEHVSGAVFTLIAVAQFIRAVLGLPAQVSTFAIPVWWSFGAAAGLGGLAGWAFRSARARQQ